LNGYQQIFDGKNLEYCMVIRVNPFHPLFPCSSILWLVYSAYLLLHFCSRLMTSSIRNDVSSITQAMAVAP